MPAPSPLAIATSSVQRLVKEEASYHKELKAQEARLEKLLASTEEDENREYSLKQETTAIEETKAVFPSIRLRIEDALAKLEDRLETDAESADAEEVAKAKQTVQDAQAAVKNK